MTNTKQQRWSLVAIALLALATTLGAVNAHAELPQQYSKTEIVQAARCLVLAQEGGASDESVKVFTAIAKPYLRTYWVSYEVGYVIGVIDAYATLKDEMHGGYVNARYAVAQQLFKQNECKANVEI